MADRARGDELRRLRRELERRNARLAAVVRRKRALDARVRAVATPTTPDADDAGASGASSALTTDDEARDVTPDDEDVDAVDRGEGIPTSETMKTFLRRSSAPACKKMAISPAKAALVNAAPAAKATRGRPPRTTTTAAPAKRLGGGGGKTSAAPKAKRKLNDEQLTECYTVMHAAVDAGDLERCEELREYFVRHEGKFVNPYKWDHELVSCCSRDGRRPIETLTWAFEHGARRDAKAGLFACERVDHELRRDQDGHYTDSLTVLTVLTRARRRADRLRHDVLRVRVRQPRLPRVDAPKRSTGSDFAELADVNKNPDGQDNDLMLIAAKNGHLPVLQYLYDNDCDFTDADAREAISNKS